MEKSKLALTAAYIMILSIAIELSVSIIYYGSINYLAESLRIKIAVYLYSVAVIRKSEVKGKGNYCIAAMAIVLTAILITATIKNI